jgi:uncharacterized protein (DUF58 family)
VLDERVLRQIERLSLVPRWPVSGGLGGDHRSRTQAPSIDFSDHRTYAPGDDLRRLDWRAYGRLGSLQVRTTEGRERLDVAIVLDCSASMALGQPDKLDYARQVAGALAAVTLQHGDALRLVCLNRATSALGPLSGRQRLPSALEFLGSAQPAGRIALDQVLPDALAPMAGAPRNRRSMVLVISDFLTDPIERLGDAFDALAWRGADVVAIRIVSPDEESPNATGQVEVLDAETGQSIEVTLTPDTVARYQARLAEWVADLERVCAQRGTRYASCRTDRPLPSLLLEDLRRSRIVH